jgi:hypothetical protein
MILHVLPGDSLAKTFEKADIEGDVAICREALVDGDVSGDTLPEFWERRARHHAEDTPGAADAYHEKVVREFAKLTALQADSEINLWFEYELFCNVNMWFCLNLVKESSPRIYRVAPSTLTENETWNGFGQMSTAELKRCFAQRVELTGEDIQLGSDLWDAYRMDDHRRLDELSKTQSQAFPMLREVCVAAIEKEQRPVAVVRDAIEDGATGFDEVFVRFKTHAGVYGYGDMQVKKIWQKLLV